MIRKATAADIAGVTEIYDKILDREEAGISHIGWIKGVYPTEKTAVDALAKGTLFVMEDIDSKGGKIAAAAKIDHEQVPVYKDCKWEYAADDNEVMVLHTLVVDPEEGGHGYGRMFVKFYEEYALEHGCRYLRIDTNEKNTVARSMYKKLGYKEVGIVPCVFNGIPDVNLVCIEKKL